MTLPQRWTRFVALLDQRESPLHLALIRIGMGLCILWDFGWTAYHGLPVALWTSTRIGGTAPQSAKPLIWMVLDDGPTAAWALWWMVMIGAVCWTVGILTKPGGWLMLLAYADTAVLNTTADRAVDRFVRVVIVLLLFSACNRCLTLWGRLRDGQWFEDGSPAPAWPRYLLIAQLVVLYTSAGTGKTGIMWHPHGDYSALYIALQDPIMSMVAGDWMNHTLVYRLTQVATAIAMTWEMSFGLILVAMYFRFTDGKSWWRTQFQRLYVLEAYVIMGVLFHLGLAATLRLGIFPWVMLAAYPALVHPRQTAAWFAPSPDPLPEKPDLSVSSTP